MDEAAYTAFLQCFFGEAPELYKEIQGLSTHSDLCVREHGVEDSGDDEDDEADSVNSRGEASNSHVSANERVDMSLESQDTTIPPATDARIKKQRINRGVVSEAEIQSVRYDVQIFLNNVLTKVGSNVYENILDQFIELRSFHRIGNPYYFAQKLESIRQLLSAGAGDDLTLLSQFDALFPPQLSSTSDRPDIQPHQQVASIINNAATHRRANDVLLPRREYDGDESSYLASGFAPSTSLAAIADTRPSASNSATTALSTSFSSSSSSVNLPSMSATVEKVMSPAIVPDMSTYQWHGVSNDKETDTSSTSTDRRKIATGREFRVPWWVPQQQQQQLHRFQQHISHEPFVKATAATATNSAATTTNSATTSNDQSDNDFGHQSTLQLLADTADASSELIGRQKERSSLKMGSQPSSLLPHSFNASANTLIRPQGHLFRRIDDAMSFFAGRVNEPDNEEVMPVDDVDKLWTELLVPGLPSPAVNVIDVALHQDKALADVDDK